MTLNFVFKLICILITLCNKGTCLINKFWRWLALGGQKFKYSTTSFSFHFVWFPGTNAKKKKKKTQYSYAFFFFYQLIRSRKTGHFGTNVQNITKRQARVLQPFHNTQMATTVECQIFQWLWIVRFPGWYALSWVFLPKLINEVLL